MKRQMTWRPANGIVAMQVNGCCHCGAIVFTATVEPETAAVCHCTDCQTLSGSAFRTIVQTPPGGLTFISGVPQVYMKTAESGRPRLQLFCGTCGSPIASTTPGPEPKPYSVRIGVLKERDALVPRSQQWVRSARAWLAGVAQLPRRDQG